MGVGIAMIKSVAIALIQEIAHPRLRPTLSTMYYGYFYTGSITAAWLTVAGLHIEGDWSWKFPCLAQLIGPVLSIIALVTCPESPRYYGKQGQVEKAHDFLAKYHANGTRDDPLVLFELAEIEAIIKEEEAAARSSYLDFFRTRGNLRRLRVIAMLGIGSNIVGNGIVAYYLSPVLKSVGITSATSITCINGGLAIWNLIFAWTAAVFSDRVGRRSLFLASMAGMFISYVFILSLSAGFASTAKAAVGAAVIPVSCFRPGQIRDSTLTVWQFLFFFYASYDIAWTALQWAYVSEVVTYTLRVKGAAIMNLLLSIGNAVSQFVNPIALAALTWKYYFVFLTIQAVYFVMFWYWLPETKGLSLEETTVLLDHDDYRHARAAVRDELTAKVEQVGLGEHHGLQDAKPEHIQIEKA